MKKLRILQLPLHESGVSYYRHYLPTLALREAGHTVLAFEDARESWVYAPPSPDAWLQEQLDQGVDLIHGGWSNNLPHIEFLVAARERYKVPIVIDYDDDVFSVDPMNVSFKHYHEGAFSRRVARLGLRVADAITCSTAPLLEALKDHCRHIYHLPNLTHPSHWQDLPRDPRRGEDKSVRVMFAGGPSHLGDLNHVREAVEWMVGHYDGKEGRPHVKLLFLTCMPDWAERWISSTRDPWRNRAFFMETGGRVATWQRIIRWVAPDVLMAPLQHNKFNESKSLIKAYDAAMVEGCAFLAENWPAYAEVPPETCIKVGVGDRNHPFTVGGTNYSDISPVHHKKHWFAPGTSNWQFALEEAIESQELRHSLSAKLRTWALENRTISTHISKWEACYQDVLSRPIVKELGDVVRPKIYAPDGQIARDLD